MVSTVLLDGRIRDFQLLVVDHSVAEGAAQFCAVLSISPRKILHLCNNSHINRPLDIKKKIKRTRYPEYSICTSNRRQKRFNKYYDITYLNELVLKHMSAKAINNVKR
ncbi:uncharacterized protein LOC112461117 [Temnothorax curvispinosus]|uniref:Uncharacterized protein LOC112461117 n=1 Tax=Temnothorax curvispinosus TaxID=300111 RepID=A0A6J1QHZ3_9HYME|nr:uncharacterized protein LOC112461117 [Temnothorax curvispinosus]